MEAYEKHEAKCKQLKIENAQYLNEFTEYLTQKELAEKTIQKHVTNIDFYLNTYLHHEAPLSAGDGTKYIHHFLGYWFIYKALWSSEARIKENITSFKHFYKFMLGKSYITADQHSELLLDIKENKEDWFQAMKEYDDPDSSFEDIW